MANERSSWEETGDTIDTIGDSWRLVEIVRDWRLEIGDTIETVGDLWSLVEIRWRRSEIGGDTLERLEIGDLRLET